MRNLIFVFALIWQQSVASAATSLETETCNQLAVDRTTVDFSSDSDGNISLYEFNNLNNKKGVEFINKTRRSMNDSLEEYCKKAPTLEGFKEKFHGLCTEQCQGNAAALGSEKAKLKGVTACFTICNRADKKLEILAQGISLGRKLANRENQGPKDCTGAVSNSKREPKIIQKLSNDLEKDAAAAKIMSR